MTDNKQAPFPGILIELDHEIRQYERSAFTLMMLLGELGGLYGIIVAIPSLFIAQLVERLFINHLAGLMPIKVDNLRGDLRDRNDTTL